MCNRTADAATLAQKSVAPELAEEAAKAAKADLKFKPLAEEALGVADKAAKAAPAGFISKYWGGIAVATAVTAGAAYFAKNALYPAQPPKGRSLRH